MIGGEGGEGGGSKLPYKGRTARHPKIYLSMYVWVINGQGRDSDYKIELYRRKTGGTDAAHYIPLYGMIFIFIFRLTKKRVSTKARFR